MLFLESFVGLHRTVQLQLFKHYWLGYFLELPWYWMVCLGNNWPGPIPSWQIDWEIMETVTDFIILSSKITADGDCSHEIKRHLPFGRKVMTNLNSIKKQRQYFANKGLSSLGYGFSNSHVWMWELDYKKSWVPNNWCFWTVVLEKTRESLELQGDPTGPS